MPLDAFLHDFLVLLVIYNAKKVKKIGGLNRLLTGVGHDGTDYKDGISLSAELELTASESSHAAAV